MYEDLNYKRFAVAEEQQFEQFGHYILLEKLAAGGMAEIHLAKKIAAEGVQKFVAVKRILAQHANSADFIRMFKDEAKIAVNLNHGNVVSIYDYGIENQQPYLVMEHVEGKNLRQILNKLKQVNKRFSLSHVAYISKMIAAGLDHAHRCIDATTGESLNIIHRDMSPQNSMISFEGEIKIIDFGIAKATTQAESTRVGQLKGKFGYMSPEQVDGMDVDSRTDIFALGIMMWEMLSEQRLFLTNNEMSTLRKVRECKIPSLRDIDPNIPMELEKIVYKALARNKSQRYQTAAELQKDLQGFLNRYNPDFSSQDFSEFIKDIYAEEIIEARKKQVNFSKIEGIVKQNSKKTLDSFTQSFTYSQNEVDKVSFVDLSLRKGEADEKSLSVNTNPALVRVPAPSRTVRAEHTSTGFHNKPQATHTQSRSQIVEPESSSPIFSFIGFGAIILAILVGGFAFLNETKPQMVAGPCQSLKGFGLPLACHEISQSRLASTTPKLKITSDPEGAWIFLDGKPTGTRTPSDLEVSSNKPFVVSVGMAGYKHVSQKFKSFPMNTNTHFKLSATPTGWVVVRVVLGEVFYNNQKLQNNQKVPVEADKPVTFKAVNPLTNATEEKTITVKANESKELTFAPR